MRIGICDDEEEIRNMLKIKIDAYGKSGEVVSYQSGEELLTEETMPDILFLDIQMPGIDGMETAYEVKKRKKESILIFVTALEEYVFQAFDVGAFHYLVKPFSDEKFYEILEKAIAEYEENKRVCKKDADRESRYMMVKTKGARIKVVFDTILYAEVFNRKIILYTTEGKVEYYGKMTELCSRLGEDFYRTHRGYLVNFKYVKKYDAAAVFLENGEQVIMAKQQFPGFVKAFLRYHKREGMEG